MFFPALEEEYEHVVVFWGPLPGLPPPPPPPQAGWVMCGKYLFPPPVPCIAAEQLQSQWIGKFLVRI